MHIELSEILKSSNTFSKNNLPIDIDHIYIDQDLIPEKPENFKEILSCLICLSVVRRPVSCEKCQESFCSICIDSHILQKKTCPKCMEDFKKTKNRVLNQLLDTISINCPSKCGQIIQYNQVTDHLSVHCEKMIKSFTCHQCNSTLEASGLNDNRLKEHVEICRYSNLNCIYCNSLLKRKDIALHIERCPKRMILCDICTTKYPAETEYAHQSYYCDVEKNYRKIRERIEKL